MKKLLAFLFLFVCTFISTAFADDYPSHEITGIISISNNNNDDVIARLIANNAVKYLGQPVSLWTFSDKHGNAALKYLQDSPNDGYTFFIGREHVSTNYELKSEPDFENLECIYIIGEATDGVTVIPIEGEMSLQFLKSSPQNFRYVPYGFAYGVYVKEGTPEDVIAKLADAFKKAGAEQEIKNMLENNNIKFSGLTGHDAQNYLEKWRGGSFITLMTGVEVNIPKQAKKSNPPKNSEPASDKTPDENNKTPAVEKGKFPEHDIEAVVQWGAGGATDILTRAATEIAAKNLPVNINVTNILGNNGAKGLEHVYSKKADGYTLLMGTENPALYDVLSISNHTYNDFECIFLIGDVASLIAVKPTSKYSTFSELINDALANPGQITFGTTGKGSLGWMMNAFIKGITGAEFNLLEYNSNSEIRTAVKNGECDVTVCLEQEGVKDFHDGTLKFLTAIAIDDSKEYPGVTAVIQEYPDFFSCLPWGSFFGIYAKKGTYPEALKILIDAYKKAGEDENFRNLLKNYSLNYLGYSGQEAAKYISRWRNNTVDALINSGAEGVSFSN